MKKGKSHTKNIQEEGRGKSRKSFDLLASIKKTHKLVTFHAWKFLF